MDRLSGMAVFAKVAEQGSFSAAARELSLSKSVVSKRVAALEDRLGARLLNRTTRKLSLTEVGQAFLERCLRVLAEAEEAELAVTRLHAEPRGLLRLTTSVEFGSLHLAPALAAFMERYPEIKVELTLADRLIDLVDEGFDLAVRIAKLTDSSMIARKLAPCRMVVCASPAYWQRVGLPRHPEDLTRLNCLNYTYSATQDDWTFAGPLGPITIRASGNLRANNGGAIMGAAVGGLGVTRVPSFICGPFLASGELQAVLQDFEPSDLDIHAIYPHNRHLSAKVRAFVDFLAERFSGRPYWDTCPD